MTDRHLQIEQQSSDANLSVGDEDLISTGQTQTDTPRLEGKKLMRVINTVIRNSILAKDSYQGKTIRGLEEVYRIGLDYPYKIDADNIQKLYENPLMMAGAKVGFAEFGDGYQSELEIEHRRAYAAHAIERFGRYSPQGIEALKTSHSHLTKEFRDEYDIPIDRFDL